MVRIKASDIALILKERKELPFILEMKILKITFSKDGI